MKLYDAGGALVKSGSTPANGRYTLSDVVMGTYTLNASKVGVGDKNVSGVIVQPKKTTWQNIELCIASLPGSIAGKVLDKVSGQGISSAKVEAKYESNNTPAKSVTTAADGTYTIDQLLATTYTVTASEPKYVSQAVPGVAVGAGKTSTVWFNLTLIPTGEGTIKGTVKDQSSNPLSGATVKAVSGSVSLTAQTIADGTYTVDKVPPGTYTVTASMTGYQTGLKTNVAVNSTGVDFALTMIKVLSSNPATGAMDVAADASITITFSVPMDTASVMQALTLVPSAGDLTPSWNTDNTSVTISHSLKFTDNTIYALTISTTAKDKDGNAMALPYVIAFTTAKAGGGGDMGLLIGIGALIAIIVVAVILFAVLRMRKKPAEGEEKKEDKKEEEKKEEAKPEEPKPVEEPKAPEAPQPPIPEETEGLKP